MRGSNERPLTEVGGHGLRLRCGLATREARGIPSPDQKSNEGQRAEPSPDVRMLTKLHLVLLIGNGFESYVGALRLAALHDRLKPEVWLNQEQS